MPKENFARLLIRQKNAKNAPTKFAKIKRMKQEGADHDPN